MRVLIDNDVVVDLLTKREPFFADAKQIFLLIANHAAQGYICAITPVNAFYTVRKELGFRAAKASVRELLGLVNICNVDKAVLSEADVLEFSDYEDAVQCAAAMAEGLDAIVTRNTKDFRNSPIDVYTPTEFLNVLESHVNE